MKQRFFDWIKALTVKVRDIIMGIALKIWRFLKKWGTQIINLIVLIIAYDAAAGTLLADFVIGLWLFILVGYYIFWKLLGAERLFKDDEE